MKTMSDYISEDNEAFIITPEITEIIITQAVIVGAGSPVKGAFSLMSIAHSLIYAQLAFHENLSDSEANANASAIQRDICDYIGRHNSAKRGQ